MAFGKSVSLQIAEYFGLDWADVKANEYQNGRWLPRVFTLDNKYYSAGVKPPRYRDWNTSIVWKEITDRGLKLWEGE